MSEQPVLEASTPSDAKHLRTLRWWPAMVLLLLMGALRFVPTLAEAPSLPIIMISFLGPAAVGMLVFAWWLFASRASWREKLLGIGGFAVIAAVGIGRIHFSLQGMGLMIMVVPTGIVAFALPLILLAAVPAYRLPVALVCTAMGFGYWDLKQSLGVTGNFSSQLLWRWQPTPEEQYLAELSEREFTASENLDLAEAPTLDLASAPWPSFRGPGRNASLAGVTVADNWDANPPKQIWNVKIGPGWSSFTLAGDYLFTQEQRGEDEAVVCLRADTGAIVWDYVYPSRFWEAVAGAGPRATPTIADEGLFALGAEGVLVSLDAASGKELWKQSIDNQGGRSETPLRRLAIGVEFEILVIVHAGGADDKGLLAYKASDGKLRWSVPSGDHSYSSPQLAEFAGTLGVLMMTNFGLQFVDAVDGKTIWEHDWKVDNYRAIQPLVFDDSVLVATSLGLGTRRLKVNREGDYPWQVTEQWTSLDMKPDFNDFILYDSHIYGFDGNIFGCVDAATGDRKWKKGRYGNGQVLLLSDAGQLLITSEKGEVVLLNANPDKLDEVARFPALDGKTWNHPILVGDRLYVRNAENAACFELPLK